MHAVRCGEGGDGSEAEGGRSGVSSYSKRGCARGFEKDQAGLGTGGTTASGSEDLYCYMMATRIEQQTRWPADSPDVLSPGFSGVALSAPMCPL